MDRIIAYPGQVPAVEDFLQAQKFAVVSAGRAIEAVMGAATIAAGFAASIDGAANLTLGPGSLTMPAVLDTLAFGVLGTDGTAITKQGISNANVVTALGSHTPGTAGYSCNVLVSGAVQDVAAGATVLSYYNTNSPTTPFNGSAGSGTAQPTSLQTGVALSFAAGAAGPAGAQSTPAAAAGYVPLYIVTLAPGAAPTVAYHPAAPFLAFTLPQLTPGYARERVFTSSGSFTVPRGSSSVRVYMWGGGGGGGGSAVAGAGAGGGGGAGYARGVVSVTPGQVIAVAVGTGGAGGAGGSGSTSGSPGTSSAFGSMTCSGGAGGSLAASAGATGGGAGGAGAGGSFAQSGIGGGAGVIFTSTSASGGIGGAAFQSSPSGLNVNAAGPAGQMPGAGGNGGASGTSGGAGAAGLVIVEY